MAALRRATTLVHALGGIDLRLLHAGKVMIAVGSGPGDRDGAVGRCGWRVAVADAYRQLESGAAVCFLHLDPGVDPVIELVPGPRCRAVGTDIYRLQIGTSLVDAFATTLGPGDCRAALDRALGVRAEPPAVRICSDELTDVTIVHAPVAAAPWASASSPLQDALAACMVDELVAEVACGHGAADRHEPSRSSSSDPKKGDTNP